MNTNKKTILKAIRLNPEQYQEVKFLSKCYIDEKTFSSVVRRAIHEEFTRQGGQ